MDQYLSCLIWDRLYDSTDYVFDFMPFWPITRGVVDSPWGDERGRLLGVSLFQLLLVWLLFAAGTWGATTFSVSAGSQARSANKRNGGDGGVTVLSHIRRLRPATPYQGLYAKLPFD